MWPSDQQQVRLHQDLLRGSQERSILQNAQAVLQQPWIANTNPQLSFPNQNVPMMNKQRQVTCPTINSLSQMPLPPSNILAPSNSAMSASQEFHLLRLLQIRQEAQALEERHALIKQHEQRMIEEIMKRRATPQQDSLNNMLRFNEASLDLQGQASADSSTVPQKEVNIASDSIDQNQEEFKVENHETKKDKMDEKKQVPKKKANRVKQQRAKIINVKDKPKIKDQKWLNTLEQLREYKEREGDCIVPRGEFTFLFCGVTVRLTYSHLLNAIMLLDRICAKSTSRKLGCRTTQTI
jgi:hypothetical protein